MNTQTLTPRLRGSVGTLLMLVLGSMYAWSYFKVALGNAYPTWSQTQITLNFTIMMISFCLGSLLAGSVLTRFLRKPVQLVLSALLLGGGFTGVSLLPADPAAALLQLYLCYGICNGLGTGIAYNAVLSGVQPWFPDCAGLISGILLMGMGIGSLVLGLLASAALQVLSLSVTFRCFGIGAMVLLLICAPVISPPRQSSPTAEAAAHTAGDFTTAAMMRRPTFWIYFLWNIMISSSGMLVINSASSIAVFYGLAAVIGLVVSVFNGSGRIVIGWCMDRLGWKRTMYLNNALVILSGGLLLLGDRIGSGLIVLLGMLVMGISYGGGITIAAALIRDLYGSRYYAANFSVSTLCLIPASILGPLISAWLQDGSGNYLSTFLMVMAISGVALVLNLFIRNP